MFLRSSVVKKGGKTYRYWKLVENVRTGNGPRQQVVVPTWAIFPLQCAADWQALAGRMGEPKMAGSRTPRPAGSRQGRLPKGTIEDRSASASDAARSGLHPAVGNQLA